MKIYPSFFLSVTLVVYPVHSTFLPLNTLICWTSTLKMNAALSSETSKVVPVLVSKLRRLPPEQYLLLDLEILQICANVSEDGTIGNVARGWITAMSFWQCCTIYTPADEENFRFVVGCLTSYFISFVSLEYSNWINTGRVVSLIGLWL